MYCNRFLHCKKSWILSYRNLGLLSTTLNSFVIDFMISDALRNRKVEGSKKELSNSSPSVKDACIATK